MELGWLDVCLRVANVATSRAFYEGLGFRRVEGDDAEGWAVVVHGAARIGLFEPRYMSEAGLSLNFRGGDVRAIWTALSASGYRFEKDLAGELDGGASATLKDPDGHAIFFELDARRDAVKTRVGAIFRLRHTTPRTLPAGTFATALGYECSEREVVQFSKAHAPLGPRLIVLPVARYRRRKPFPSVPSMVQPDARNTTMYCFCEARAT